MAVKDIIISPGTLRTFVTDRKMVESKMPFINVDCALVYPKATTEVKISKGTILTVKAVSKPEMIDLAKITPADMELEYAFQFGAPIPKSLKNRIAFQRAISDEYIKFYGSEAIGETRNILRSFLDVQSEGRTFKIQCENKINEFEIEHLWDVFDTSDSLNTIRMVEFVIKKGTGRQSWNTKENPIRAKVGDIIRFINEDDVTHQLHTYGAPCEHQWNAEGEIEPGESWDCPASKPWNSLDEKEGPLHNHLVGQEAKVWIVVTPKD